MSFVTFSLHTDDPYIITNVSIISKRTKKKNSVVWKKKMKYLNLCSIIIITCKETSCCGNIISRLLDQGTKLRNLSDFMIDRQHREPFQMYKP